MTTSQILGYVISPLFTAIIGFLISQLSYMHKKNKEREKRSVDEYEALKETCKYTLRQFLKEDYEFYVEGQGYCSLADKEEVERAYLLYHDKWNGNGQGTRYYKAIMALPEHPEQENH